MGKILGIAQLGHPVLRQLAQPVSDVRDPTLQGLADDLLATVADAGGVGLAAPQVYQSQRLFVVASKPNPRYPDAPEMAPVVMFNPVILERSQETSKDWEGCLSIPGIRGLVPRSCYLRVAFTRCDGERVELELAAFVARIFQHELDHLDGIVFLDRLESVQEVISEKEYRKLVAS